MHNAESGTYAPNPYILPFIEDQLNDSLMVFGYEAVSMVDPPDLSSETT